MDSEIFFTGTLVVARWLPRKGCQRPYCDLADCVTFFDIMLFGAAMIAHIVSAFVGIISVVLSGSALAGDFIWKRVDVATYPAGVDIAHGLARNHIVYLEVAGPPRNMDEAQKELMQYAQESVNMALGSALVAFEDTPGEISVKAGAAYGQFQSTITYRATQVSAFRSMATFDIREAEEEVSSDSLKLEWHDPNKAITAELANRLKTAFPATKDQIDRLADAYVYVNSLSNPPIAFSVNVKEIANKLAVPPDVINKTATEARKFTERSTREVTEAVNSAIKRGTQQVADRIKHLSDEIEKQAGRFPNFEAWRQRFEALYRRELSPQEAAPIIFNPASGIVKPEDVSTLAEKRLGHPPSPAEAVEISKNYGILLGTPTAQEAQNVLKEAEDKVKGWLRIQ
jgi:hypothetical protein